MKLKKPGELRPKKGKEKKENEKQRLGTSSSIENSTVVRG